MSQAIASKATRLPLKGLTSGSFQHPADRQTIEALQKIRGFDFIVGKFVEYGIERVEYVRNHCCPRSPGTGRSPALTH